jgi:DNA-binding NarL/FixJ family response regulator
MNNTAKARGADNFVSRGAVRILLADDHEIVRRGLSSLIQEQSGWQVVAEVSDGREVVAKAAELQPDVAILDISMPTLNGLDATKQILKQSPRTKVLVLTVHDSEQLIRDLIKTGVRGYILKADASRDFVTAVHALVSGKTFFTPKVAQLVLDGFIGKNAQPTGESQRLSNREREIVQLLAEGKSSKEVATVLSISVKTAETHRANIMRKLEMHSVSELVRYAVRNRIVEA